MEGTVFAAVVEAFLPDHTMCLYRVDRLAEMLIDPGAPSRDLTPVYVLRTCERECQVERIVECRVQDSWHGLTFPISDVCAVALYTTSTSSMAVMAERKRVLVPQSLY